MVVLPTGVVTFLFTDIEGSTALWQRYPEAMPGVIARHDAILKEVIAAHRGVVFRTVGDAVHAAFGSPGDAVAAALAAQRALAAEDWPEGIVIRVRMGIHTGAVDVQDGEYAGHTLNRVARITAAGHGGQILLSAATTELVRHVPPPGVTFRDMGEHHLKDLVLPERIYAAEAPDLPSGFPPLRTLDKPQTNLPLRRAALLGRESELEAAKTLLSRECVGLVTFTGAGGTGKTSLAIVAGHELLGHFPDGVWFVPLASISDPGLVPSAVMASLGLREEGGRLPMEVLHDFLGPKRMLLILDNFEQVVGAAPAVAELLQAAPGLAVLVTSRIALRLGDEHELPIAPLSLPDRGSVHDLQRLSQYGAVQLFIERAQQVKPSFHVTDENAVAVAEICSRLDGLPLAIELAAARIRILTPEVLLGRLDKRLPLLRGGVQDLPARQQTMEAAIAWSYDLLTKEEQVLYRRLAVFSGTFSLEAAEAVCGDAEIDLLDELTLLVDKSLVRQNDVGEEPRFSMLQTIREYGLARLEESVESDLYHRRYATYFADLAGILEREGAAAGYGAVAARTEAEWENFRGALDWSLGESGDQQLALRLVATLGSFFLFSNHSAEGRVRTEALFARRGAPAPDEAWAAALITRGVLELQRGDFTQGLAHLHESKLALEGSDDLLRRALLLNWLAISALNMGDAQRAERLFTESREISLALDLPWAATSMTGSIAESLAAQGRLDEADATAAEAAAGFRNLRDPWGTSRMESIRGLVAWLRGDYAAAHQRAADAIGSVRLVTEPYNLSRTLTIFGYILVDEARYEEAVAILTESLLNWKALSNSGGMSLSLAALTAALAGQGKVEQARRLYASELFHRKEMAVLLDGLMDPGFDHFTQCIRERLGDQPAGDTPAMTLEEAVDYALEA